MKDKTKATYEAPQLTQILLEANDILLASVVAGELDEDYTAGARSNLNFGDIFNN